MITKLAHALRFSAMWSESSGDLPVSYSVFAFVLASWYCASDKPSNFAALRAFASTFDSMKADKAQDIRSNVNYVCAQECIGLREWVYLRTTGLSKGLLGVSPFPSSSSELASSSSLIATLDEVSPFVFSP